MDMNRLHYFCTVVQTGSIVKASELLGISQPALSKALKTLESEINKKILIPSGRGIAVTDYGKILAASAQPLLEQFYALKDLETQTQPRLRFSTFEVFSTYFLGRLIHSDFQDIDVDVLEKVPGPLEDSISGGLADIGITYLPVPKQDIDIFKVGSIEMAVYGLKNSFEKIDFQQLPFVIPYSKVEGAPSKAKGLDGWPDNEHPRKIKYQVTMMETALDLCRRGLCVGYFPKFVVELHNETVLHTLRLEKIKSPLSTKSSRQDLFLIKRKTDVEDSNFKKVARALRNLK